MYVRLEPHVHTLIDILAQHVGEHSEAFVKSLIKVFRSYPQETIYGMPHELIAQAISHTISGGVDKDVFATLYDPDTETIETIWAAVNAAVHISEIERATEIDDALVSERSADVIRFLEGGNYDLEKMQYEVRDLAPDLPRETAFAIVIAAIREAEHMPIGLAFPREGVPMWIDGAIAAYGTADDFLGGHKTMHLFQTIYNRPDVQRARYRIGLYASVARERGVQARANNFGYPVGFSGLVRPSDGNG